MITQEEKAIILCEHFKPAYLEYERELAEGYDPEESYWYGFAFEANDGSYRVFDFRFTTDDDFGNIVCYVMECHENSDGEYTTDVLNEIRIL